MSTENLKKNTVSGIIWKLAERIGAQVVSMVVSIILARLLTAEDYSVVGIVTIFFTFANVIISSGFNTALIQKKDADIEDYSSVLYISLALSAVLYIILFFTAPLISSIYSMPILIPVIRVMGITLIINAFQSILCAYISSKLQFKKFFLSTLGGVIVSAIVGIGMAVSGFGPWALVAQQMTNSVIGTVILALTTRVKFALVFNLEKVKGLFNYGWKILVSAIITVIYDEINPLIIGIRFTTSDLSYYTKGKSFPSLISNAINDTLSSVLFPVISKIQDDIGAVLNCTRRFIKVASYLVFPLMVGFLAVSDSFVRVVLTDKWMPASIYIQIFCLSYMFNIIQHGNLQAIRAIGRSDIVLILEIIKKSIYFVVILAFILLSNKPQLLAVTAVINTVFATAINTYPNRKLIGYKYRMQIMDLLPNFLLAAAMGTAVFALKLLNLAPIALLPLQILVGAVVYVLGSIITRNENFYYLLSYIKGVMQKKKG